MSTFSHASRKEYSLRPKVYLISKDIKEDMYMRYILINDILLITPNSRSGLINFVYRSTYMYWRFIRLCIPSNKRARRQPCYFRFYAKILWWIDGGERRHVAAGGNVERLWWWMVM